MFSHLPLDNEDCDCGSAAGWGGPNFFSLLELVIVAPLRVPLDQTPLPVVSACLFCSYFLCIWNQKILRVFKVI